MATPHRALCHPTRISKSTVLIATVQEDEPLVTRKELWSYYLYYNGDNGVGPLSYTQTLFQSLATAAGYDPTVGPGSSCLSDTASGQCVLPWMGGTKSIASVVLVANGISFAVMTAIFTTIGSAGDYGTFGRWLLFTLRIAGNLLWGSISSDSFPMGQHWFSTLLHSPVSPGIPLTPVHLREKYENGDISVEEYEREESLEKNRISNISTVHSNVGYVVTYLLNLALLLPPKTANDPKVDNYTLALDNSYWVFLGIWWFIYQSPRPGPSLPKGESYFTIGWKQGLNTTGTLVAICQNDKFSFSFLQNTYLGLSQAITSTISTLGFWYIQRYWKISTKKMFVVTNVVTILIPLWGMIGMWTDKLGFHNVWEFWAYNVVFGLFQAPYYAFSQTMMAELSPPGFDNMFFGLFGLSNRASSMVGPYVVQAIIGKTHDNWQGFPFLFAICTAASLVIWFGVDVAKGRRDAVRWAAAQRG
ncbi:MFS general substrate transporter [Lanmaoa asiatica]|nr:MFS general substrate transporter [Lanmaoa asiatica]